MTAYYNDNDPYCAQWLRNLIAAGHLPPGDVDERDIREVKADDVRGYTQVHFFAGLGGWPYALRLAGWGDGRPVWTGSCPCQPVSSAGQRKGHADERHLWPAFHRLIAECKPAVVFGEQVASLDGREWLSAVRADLEHLGYAIGAADLPAAGVSAPHGRARLFFVADADGRHPGPEGLQRGGEHGQRPQDGGAVRVEHTAGARQYGALERPEGEARHEARLRLLGEGSGHGGLAHTGHGQLPQPQRGPQGRNGPRSDGAHDPASGWRPSSLDGFWRDADWLLCRDGKWRPVEPGTFPLAHGIPARMAKLRAFGNAIIPQVAAAFVMAADDRFITAKETPC